jgi:hypothetical protein
MSVFTGSCDEDATHIARIVSPVEIVKIVIARRRNRSAAVRVIFRSAGFFMPGLCWKRPVNHRSLLVGQSWRQPVTVEKEGKMQDVWSRSPAVVIAFPDATERPQRPLAANEPRGEILFFTGIRYERPAPKPGPTRPFASRGPGTRRRS